MKILSILNRFLEMFREIFEVYFFVDISNLVFQTTVTLFACLKVSFDVIHGLSILKTVFVILR
jgi:hypothetical protein